MSIYIIFLILVTLVLLTINKIVTKKLANVRNALAITYLANILSFLFLLPVVLLSLNSGTNQTNFDNFYFVIIGGTIWTFAGIFSTISVKKADVSLREPIITTRILWVSLLGIFFLGEHITLNKSLAIILIFTGILVATLKNKKIKDVFDNGGSWVFLSAILTSVAVFVDKIASANIGTLMYTFFIFLIPAIIQSFLLPKIKNDCVEVLKNHLVQIITISGTQAIFFYTQFKLYSLLPISTIYPILQFSSILVILAAMIFLNERTNIKNRLLGTFIASVGVVLFKVFA